MGHFSNISLLLDKAVAYQTFYNINIHLTIKNCNKRVKHYHLIHF